MHVKYKKIEYSTKHIISLLDVRSVLVVLLLLSLSK